MGNWKRAVALLGVAIVLAACGPKEPPPPVVEEPPPPTALEIKQEIMQPIMPIIQQYNRPWKELKEIPESVRHNGFTQLKMAKQKHLSGVNSEDGFRQATNAIEENLNAANAGEAWSLTLFLWHMLNEITPGRAANYTNYRDRAMTFVQMPRPTVTGFFQQGDAPVVFMDVYLPTEKRTEKVRVREGEEFHGMQLVEIKGRNRGAIVEHIQSGEVLDLDYGSATSR